MTEAEPTPTAICVGYLEAFATGQPDVVASFVTDDFVNEHTSALGSGCVGTPTARSVRKAKDLELRDSQAADEEKSKGFSRYPYLS